MGLFHNCSHLHWGLGLILRYSRVHFHCINHQYRSPASYRYFHQLHLDLHRHYIHHCRFQSSPNSHLCLHRGNQVTSHCHHRYHSFLYPERKYDIHLHQVSCWGPGFELTRNLYQLVLQWDKHLFFLVPGHNQLMGHQVQL